MSVNWDWNNIKKRGVKKFFEITNGARQKVQQPSIIPSSQDSIQLEEGSKQSRILKNTENEHKELSLIKQKFEEDQVYENLMESTTFLMEPESIELDNNDIQLPKASSTNLDDNLYVYDTYDFNYEYDQSLPVVDHRDYILDVVNSHHACIIAGSTGSGKTTVIPQFILDDHFIQRKYCNIIITQPRKVAAVSTATRVSSERRWPIGSLVGYSVSLSKMSSEDTRLHYVTTGVLLQCLVSNPSFINHFTHIIIDEAHERTEEIDLCLLVLKNHIKESQSTKVIVMSATLETSIFANYFSIQINDISFPAPVVEITGRLFDVPVYYLDNIPLISSNTFIHDSPEYKECAISTCIDIIKNLSSFDFTFHKLPADQRCKAVLIFLPGLNEILALHHRLLSLVEEYKLVLLDLHSKLPPDKQWAVFKPPPVGYRKIIIATNIAESSITVPDVGYVIDFCLHKQVHWDSITNLCHLKLCWVSKSSAEQRRGRAGRVSNGICFRLINRSVYDKFDEYNTPDMKSKPLENVVLNIKKLFKGPPIIMLQEVLEPPLLSDVHRSILLLKETGALTLTVDGQFDSNDGNLTLLGEIARMLPLDIKSSKLIAIGYIFGMLDQCVVIAASISLGCIFVTPLDQELEFYQGKWNFHANSFSDHITYLELYKTYFELKQLREFSQKRRTWGRENCVNIKKLDEVCDLVSDIFGKLGNLGVSPNFDMFTHPIFNAESILLLRLLIAAAFYPNYFYSNNVNLSNSIRSFKKDPLSTICLPNIKSYADTSAIRRNILDTFSACGNIASIEMENRRAYVEFVHPLDIEDEVVLPAVFFALYMNRIRNTSNRFNLMKSKLCQPSNPLVFSFSGCTQTFVNRRVKVNNLSINAISVGCHTELTDNHVLISSYITLYPNGNQLTLGETSLMPSYPGLLEILVLLFTPVAELRVDFHNSRYTGALCGLGLDPISHRSIFGQNDIDITIPVHFDNEDLQMINAIRSYMNTTLGNNPMSYGACIKNVKKWQNDACNTLINLVTKNRVSKPLVSCDHPYQWKVSIYDKSNSSANKIFRSHDLAMLDESTK